MAVLTESRSARVIDVRSDKHGATSIVLVIADSEHVICWSGPEPEVGDIFVVSADDPPMIIDRIGQAMQHVWDSRGDAMRWRRPMADGSTRMAVLWKRHAIRRAVREYLDSEGFIEIDTPHLVHGTTPDAAVQSFSIGERYLITSAEYQIKRLEAGGFDKIYTLTQNYRSDDVQGRYRNPEFTMLEWARVGGSLARIEGDVERLVLEAQVAIGGMQVLHYNGREIDLSPPWERASVAEAIERYSGAPITGFSLEEIQKTVRTVGLPLREVYQDDVYFLFSLLMDHIQPSLGLSRPVFLHDWPAFETSSVSERADMCTAERSELFIGGVELSDGFPTLTSFDYQKLAFDRQLERRQKDGILSVELDELYVGSLRNGIPAGAGMALGFDRLVMLLTGQNDIKSVLAFAWDEV